MTDDDFADSAASSDWDYETVERSPEERRALREREPSRTRANGSRYVPTLTREDGRLVIRTRK